MGSVVLLWAACGLAGLGAATPVALVHRDVGAIPAGRDTPYAFLLTNAGPAAIEIARTGSSCDCLEVEVAPNRIDAGAAGLFGVRLRPRNPGPFVMGLDLEPRTDVPPPIVILSGVATVSAAADPDPGLLVEPRQFIGDAAAGGPVAGAGSSRVGGVVFVDVRSQEAYRWARVPGSVNFPLHTLAARRHLRERRVVLVNAGESAADLVETAARLRTNGFPAVAVLEGGLRAWQQAGGSVVGDQVESPRWAEVPPWRFHAARAEAGWLLVAVRGPQGGDGGVWIPGMPQLDLATGALRGRLEALLRAHPATRRVMLLSPRPETDVAIEAGLRGFGAVPVFYLAGGSEAYTDYLRLEIGLRARGSVTVSSRQPSGPGAPRAGQVIAAGHSGGCCGGRR